MRVKKVQGPDTIPNFLTPFGKATMKPDTAVPPTTLHFTVWSFSPPPFPRGPLGLAHPPLSSQLIWTFLQGQVIHHLPGEHCLPKRSGKKGRVGRGQRKGKQEVRRRRDATEEPRPWSSTSGRETSAMGKRKQTRCVPQGVDGRFRRLLSAQQKEKISNSPSSTKMGSGSLGSSSSLEGYNGDLW